MDSSYYNLVAKNLTAARRLWNVDVVARLEDSEDVMFWQTVFHVARPSVRVKFLPCSISNSGMRVTGKKNCLKYINELNEHYVICVDSDFDNILQPGLLDVSKYILQTYAYSWENHYCWVESLQTRWESLGVNDFNFSEFIAALSEVIYEPLLMLLTAKANGIKNWSLDSMCSAILGVQPNQKLFFENAGKAYVEKIAQQLDSWVESHDALPGDSLANMRTTLTTLNITPTNAYLYMQGHCIYDLILRLGIAMCDGKNDFKGEVLDIDLAIDGYDEIERIQKDIRTIA